MCLVIDMNAIPNVFNQSSPDHLDYKPVLDWLLSGNGKMVCGGTEYWRELSKIGKYLKFFNQLNKAGKVVKVDDKSVDLKMHELKALCTDADFDDPHIAALLIISGCNVVCSEDARSYPYITRKEWYPKGRKVPKIYKRSAVKHASKIFTDGNIADLCRPCNKLRKEQAQKLYSQS